MGSVNHSTKLMGDLQPNIHDFPIAVLMLVGTISLKSMLKLQHTISFSVFQKYFMAKYTCHFHSKFRQKQITLFSMEGMTKIKTKEKTRRKEENDKTNTMLVRDIQYSMVSQQREG